MPKFIKFTPDSIPEETRPGDRVGTYFIMLFVTAWWRFSVHEWVWARQQIEQNKNKLELTKKNKTAREAAEAAEVAAEN